MNQTEQLKNYTKDLTTLIQQIHTDCFQLCKNALGSYLPIAGNIGIFCQSQPDFEKFTSVREALTEPIDNPNQKYYHLINPIIIPSIQDIPETTYTFLYIRKPAPDTPELGDVDFVLPYEDFVSLKQKVASEQSIANASIYNRPGWDMIELKNPNIKAVAYISYQEMAEKVRVRFD